eukprot:1841200-Ditylum_brightwellii.AAC.1
MKVAVVLPFVVYDGFDKDLLAEEVYKRILGLDDQNPSWVSHAKDFLRAYTMRRNVADTKPHMDANIFTAMTSRAAK